MRSWEMRKSDLYPHDTFEDVVSRVLPEDHRIPRLIAVYECSDGQLSFGEIDKHGILMDTTLTGAVLSPIERLIRERNQPEGTVTVDGIVYAFTFSRCE